MHNITRRIALIALFAARSTRTVRGQAAADTKPTLPRCRSTIDVGRWTVEVSTGFITPEATLSQAASISGINGAEPLAPAMTFSIVLRSKLARNYQRTKALPSQLRLQWHRFSHGGNIFKELDPDDPNAFPTLPVRSAEVTIDVDGKPLLSEKMSTPTIDVTFWQIDAKAETLSQLFRAKRAVCRLALDGQAVLQAKIDLNGLNAARARVEPEINNVSAKARQRQCDSSPCFLTTATCDALGLPDDCFELVMLRRYRDDVLVKTDAGRAEVSAYYALAPHVLGELAPRWTRGDWLRLYLGLALPCAGLIRIGIGGLAHRLYRWRVRRIERSLAAVPV